MMFEGAHEANIFSINISKDLLQQRKSLCCPGGPGDWQGGPVAHGMVARASPEREQAASHGSRWREEEAAKRQDMYECSY